MKLKNEITSQNRKYQHEIRMTFINKLSPDELKVLYPKTLDLNSGLRVEGDGAGKDNAIAKPDLQKVKEWMATTDEILAGISDTVRKRDVTMLLANTIKTENWYS